MSAFHIGQLTGLAFLAGLFVIALWLQRKGGSWR